MRGTLGRDLDPLRDQGVAYARLAKAQGARVVHIEAEGMIHGFVNMRGALPSANEDVDQALASGLDLRKPRLLRRRSTLELLTSQLVGELQEEAASDAVIPAGIVIGIAGPGRVLDRHRVQQVPDRQRSTQMIGKIILQR